MYDYNLEESAKCPRCGRPVVFRYVVDDTGHHEWINRETCRCGAKLVLKGGSPRDQEQPVPKVEGYWWEETGTVRIENDIPCYNSEDQNINADDEIRKILERSIPEIQSMIREREIAVPSKPTTLLREALEIKIRQVRDSHTQDDGIEICENGTICEVEGCNNMTISRCNGCGCWTCNSHSHKRGGLWYCSEHLQT